jgi:RimJ/RimL family protein N-acetyltransferase
MSTILFPELTRDDVFMIGTQRLWLRWPRLEDAAALARIGGHPDVAAMTASWPVGCDVDYARDRIGKMRSQNAAGTGLTLVLARRMYWSETIGMVGIGASDEAAVRNRPVGGLGYHLAPEHWQRGFATEALTGLLGMTRLLTRIGQVSAAVMPHNPASARVLTKTGFTLVGRGQHTSPLRGTFDVDTYRRALTGVAPLPIASPPSPVAPAFAAGQRLAS